MSVYSTALEMHVAVTILRVQEGLDYTGIIRDFDRKDLANDNQNKEGIDNPTFENPRDSCVTASIHRSFSTYNFTIYSIELSINLQHSSKSFPCSYLREWGYRSYSSLN
jgi:siderophore synthetase component